MDLKQATNRRHPTQNRSKERVQIILNAVKEIIEEKGIAELKVAEIARRANTSPGSIYQYFSDKQTIIISLAEHFMEKIHEIVDRNLEGLNSIDDLDKVIGNNFDDIYQLHKDESALRQIWFDSIDPELSRLAMHDCNVNTDKILTKILQVVKPKDEDRLRQFLLLTNIQFGGLMRLCFAEGVGTPEQLKRVHIDMILANVDEYVAEKLK